MPTKPGDESVAPAKALRLLGTLSAGLEELNRVNLDDSARRRVIAAHGAAHIEVASTVSDALIDELVALRVELLAQDASVDQIKVAQAQLLGWVNGIILSEVNFGTPEVIDAAGVAPHRVADQRELHSRRSTAPASVGIATLTATAVSPHMTSACARPLLERQGRRSLGRRPG